VLRNFPYLFYTRIPCPFHTWVNDISTHPMTISYMVEQHFHASHHHFIHGWTTFPCIPSPFHTWVNDISMHPMTISYMGEQHFHVSYDHFIHGWTTFPSILRIFHTWVMLLDFLKC